MNLYKELFAALNEHEIQYLVIGGIAVNLHGYSRFTGDVDIVMALDAANLERMDVLMKDRGFAQRLPVELRALSNEEQLKQWLQEKNMTAYTFVDSNNPQFSIDILAGDSLNFHTLNERKVEIKAWDIPIPVIAFDDLIEMKRKANRQKDAEDIAALLSLKDL